MFNPAEGGPADRRAASGRVAARNIATSAYTDFWRGAGVDRARLAQALPQLPDTADELNAVAKDVGAAEADIHLGRDASEATLKRAPLAQYSIIYFATHGLVAGDIKGVGEPSLALSIPDQPSELDDGLLTASEVGRAEALRRAMLVYVDDTSSPRNAYPLRCGDRSRSLAKVRYDRAAQHLCVAKYQITLKHAFGCAIIRDFCAGLLRADMRDVWRGP